MYSNDLVTVYIATHNRIDLLLRAVDSVLAQTYPHIELIVADDGSSDDTHQALMPYIESGKLLYVKNDTPKGACVARNLAITMAKGTYITGLDDDDVITPNRVEHLLSEYLQGDYSCIAGSITERTPQGNIIRRSGVGKITLEDLLHHNLLGNQILTRTANLRAIGGFDPDMPAFQDYDTWVRLVAKFGVAYKSKEPSYIWFTDHTYGRISESSTRRIKAFELFYKKHRHLMTERHKASLEILRRKLADEPFGLFDFVKYTNKANIKYSLSLFINQNIKPIKFLLDWVRINFKKS